MIVRTVDGEERSVSIDELSAQSPHSPVWQELNEFISAISEGREPEITGYDGMAAVELAEAAYMSIETKKPVPIPLVER
jgi:predicted dehydrogenase